MNKSTPTKPGLHRIGPNPWDFVFVPAIGLKVGFVDRNGQLQSGTISDFNEDHERTGELRLEVDL